MYAALAQNAYKMGNPAKVMPVDMLPAGVGGAGGAGGGSIVSMGSLGDSEKGDVVGGGGRVRGELSNETKLKLQEAALRLSELDNYRFGSANGRILPQVTGSETDILARWQYHMQKGGKTWGEVDACVWNLIWDWGCIHANLAACRCSATLLINKSDCPIQITRVHMYMGRRVCMYGSEATGYETESRLIRPGGYIVCFIYAYTQSPIEMGHIKAHINTIGCNAYMASTQRETRCEAKGGFVVGFLEKTCAEWWSKNVVLIT
ncbi:hypothetical protein EON65_34010 [archaeon]|nr:MAG: hypothetical protein EON65_34010 [archaeon]